MDFLVKWKGGLHGPPVTKDVRTLSAQQSMPGTRQGVRSPRTGIEGSGENVQGFFLEIKERMLHDVFLFLSLSYLICTSRARETCTGRSIAAKAFPFSFFFLFLERMVSSFAEEFSCRIFFTRLRACVRMPACAFSDNIQINISERERFSKS